MQSQILQASCFQCCICWKIWAFWTGIWVPNKIQFEYYQDAKWSQNCCIYLYILDVCVNVCMYVYIYTLFIRLFIFSTVVTHFYISKLSSSSVLYFLAQFRLCPLCLSALVQCVCELTCGVVTGVCVHASLQGHNKV